MNYGDAPRAVVPYLTVQYCNDDVGIHYLSTSYLTLPSSLPSTFPEYLDLNNH